MYKVENFLYLLQWACVISALFAALLGSGTGFFSLIIAGIAVSLVRNILYAFLGPNEEPSGTFEAIVTPNDFKEFKQSDISDWDRPVLVVLGIGETRSGMPPNLRTEEAKLISELFRLTGYTRFIYRYASLALNYGNDLQIPARDEFMPLLSEECVEDLHLQEGTYVGSIMSASPRAFVFSREGQLSLRLAK